MAKYKDNGMGLPVLIMLSPLFAAVVVYLGIKTIMDQHNNPTGGDPGTNYGFGGFFTGFGLICLGLAIWANKKMCCDSTNDEQTPLIGRTPSVTPTSTGKSSWSLFSWCGSKNDLETGDKQRLVSEAAAISPSTVTVVQQGSPSSTLS